jgi:hypothetical protein
VRPSRLRIHRRTRSYCSLPLYALPSLLPPSYPTHTYTGTDCQKWTGAAYTSNVVVPRTNFSVTKGSPKDYDAVGASGKINKHWVGPPFLPFPIHTSIDDCQFCGTCGSSLYTELEVMPDMTCVKSGSLDGGAADHPIAVEFYNKDRLSYTKPIEGADQKPEFS